MPALVPTAPTYRVQLFHLSPILASSAVSPAMEHLQRPAPHRHVRIEEGEKETHRGVTHGWRCAG
jgi:hypothetical protein